MARYPFLWLSLLLLTGCMDSTARYPVQQPDPEFVAAIPTRDDPRCLVLRVVDGDTIELACQTRANQRRSGNVRLTGFDTPETFRPKCTAEARLGQKASQFLEARLRTAERIGITYSGNDKYGRPLVGLSLDGVALHKMMIGAGLALPYHGEKRPEWCRRLAAS